MGLIGYGGVRCISARILLRGIYSVPGVDCLEPKAQAAGHRVVAGQASEGEHSRIEIIVTRNNFVTFPFTIVKAKDD